MNASSPVPVFLSHYVAFDWGALEPIRTQPGHSNRGKQRNQQQSAKSHESRQNGVIATKTRLMKSSETSESTLQNNKGLRVQIPLVRPKSLEFQRFRAFLFLSPPLVLPAQTRFSDMTRHDAPMTRLISPACLWFARRLSFIRFLSDSTGSLHFPHTGLAEGCRSRCLTE
ncbi:hypothetical protein Tam1G_1441 [Bifidobacterium imperatoris]|uniref:Uncharacterized protein n=1 Tax=Bifidobacterium imperatoris TaxID=2020965 RepID=A0A2N5IRE3_9BIFI|nr:hypothetical protein Tam1G_1441 [Bifidobacterium imperatoris]